MSEPATELEPDDIGQEQHEPVQRQMDAAFINSAGHVLTLNGASIPLEPYSPARMVAAQAMNLRWDVLDENDRATFRETKLYPGAVRDVIIVLWLCTLKKRPEITAAGRAPEAAYEKAEDWATALGIHDPKREAFWIAYTLFFEIQNEIAAADIDAEKKTTNGKGATDRKPGTI
jgi:hypothetical protein